MPDINPNEKLLLFPIKCVVHWGVCCRDLKLAPSTVTLALEGTQAHQWQCCSGGTSCTEWLCPRACNNSGSDVHKHHHTSY